jgi:signal transduction histidine kinase
VLQESLTNIHRHSGSHRAKIRAGIDDEAVYLEVTDYGRGISQEILESFKTSGNGVGVGLAGIRERIPEVDGKFDLHSTSDGTIVRVSLLAANSRVRCQDAAAGAN